MMKEFSLLDLLNQNEQISARISVLGAFSKFRGELEVRPTRYSHGPLGEAGIAGCGCMVPWWWVETCTIGCMSFQLVLGPELSATWPNPSLRISLPTQNHP